MSQMCRALRVESRRTEIALGWNNLEILNVDGKAQPTSVFCFALPKAQISRTHKIECGLPAAPTDTTGTAGQ